MTREQQVFVERADEYSADIAEAIGRLMPFLSKRSNGEPISEVTLRAIIESPDSEQFVARLEGRVVGSAVLNTITGDLGRNAWLADFVTDSEVRGQGIGDKIWQDMIAWCQEKGLKVLDFTSGIERTDEHSFYIAHGAQQRQSIAYRMEIPEGERG